MILKEIVKGTTSRFSHYRQGFVYYEVDLGKAVYSFPVSLEDLEQATLLAEHKTITLMRYVRKALDDKTFVKVRDASNA